jgi:hypothetical protein
VRATLGTVALVVGALAHTGGQTGEVPAVTCTIAPDKAVPIAVAPDRRVYCGLDLGSNNVKLITLSVAGGSLETVRDERQCRSRLSLGAHAFDQAAMTAKAVAPIHVGRLVTVLREMQGLCQHDGGRVVGADATQWARDATNIGDIRAEVKKATGLDIEVLSGADEGRYGYISSTRRRPGKIVVDPGSNSFQLTFWVRGAPDIESVSVPFGYVRAAARFFANPSIAIHAAARTQYIDYVKAELNAALGRLIPRRSLAAIRSAVARGALDAELALMGQDGDIQQAVEAGLRPAGAIVTTPPGTEARLKPAKPLLDPVYGEISGRLMATRMAEYLRRLTPAEFARLRTSPVREASGEKILAVPVLAEWLARELGLRTVIEVPAEMPNGFVLARVGRQ